MANHSRIAEIFAAFKLNSTINAGACAGLQWLEDTASRKLRSINPADTTILAQVNACTEKQYQAIIAKAAKTAVHWRNLPAPERGEIIRQIGYALRQHKELLGELVALETGKIKQEGLGEVQEMIDMADFAVGQSRMLYGYTMHSERPQHRMYEQWQPLGVVGVITAFNFPVAVWAWNAFLAAVCGNTVVWKPSSQTPLCAIAVQHICNAIMQNHHLDGVFSLAVFNDKNLANQFVDDPRIPLISFTGSTATGRTVAERVARRLGRSLLELGGNNAVIVDESADLKLAVPAILFSAIGTAGQRCTTLRRLFIQDAVYDDLVASLKHAYQQVRIGNPLDEKIVMGPLINAQAVENYLSAITELKQLGGKILIGGSTLPGKGYYVEPTLAAAENHWELVQRETFAPILYLIRYQQFEEAVAMQNQSEHGLSSALFSQSLHHIEYFLSANGSDCGIANINIGTSGAEIGGAFGGEKATGGGREAGSDAWKAYMRRQTCTINWSDAIPLAQGIKFNINN